MKERVKSNEKKVNLKFAFNIYISVFILKHLP